jgi:hypothetical protein
MPESGQHRHALENPSRAKPLRGEEFSLRGEGLIFEKNPIYFQFADSILSWRIGDVFITTLLTDCALQPDHPSHWSKQAFHRLEYLFYPCWLVKDT